MDVGDVRLYKLQCRLDEGLTIEDIRFTFNDQTGPRTKNYLGHITFSIDPSAPGISFGDAIRNGALRGLGVTTVPLYIKPGVESKSDVTVDDEQAVYNTQFRADDLAPTTRTLGPTKFFTEY